MVKKRKSIRKAPTVIVIEGEEQAFETAPDTDPDAPQDIDMSDGHANGKDAPRDGDEVEEGSAWLDMSEKDRERALEEWLTFKEEHHESTFRQYPIGHIIDMVVSYRAAPSFAISIYVTLKGTG